MLINNDLLSSYQRHKFHRLQRLPRVVVVLSGDNGEFLAAGRTDGNNQSSTRRKLLKQLFRNFRCRCRYDNPIVRTVLAPALPAVTQTKLDVINIEIT